MKPRRHFLVTALLCAALWWALWEPPKASAPGLPAAILVLSAAAIASCIIIKVLSKPPISYTPRRLVLERSYHDGIWVPLCTNTVVLGSNTPMSVFSDRMTDEFALYRVREIPVE